MKKIICLYKPVGETPLETILRFRENNFENKAEKISVAGRLDPMAEGLLLVLIGDENKKRNKYEDLEKTYRFSVLFGITTDSYDLLGLPVLHRNKPLDAQAIKKAHDFAESLPGTHQQAYPAFSSKTVRGKPLYYWAREGKLHEITIPTKTVTISKLTYQNQSTTTANVIGEKINRIIPHLHGEFRQAEILKAWNSLIRQDPDASFSILNFSVTCSSGTYVRSIAHQMGEYLGTTALAYAIERTQIGTYTLEDAMHI